ncbi:hypothetical protein TTRE_0000009301 [Trichuris trichiura]|uniref:Uncharacterized protein n=1 Tax=Trichuris trichiura TaxID=36087 RepID=A0A077YVQ4_TRITR|nr:hypothetical protein TTRE_0000009301 [Trichuris trichiura]
MSGSLSGNRILPENIRIQQTQKVNLAKLKKWLLDQDAQRSVRP